MASGPTVFATAEHLFFIAPDQALYYNDDSPGLALAWEQAFAGRQGYYWAVNTTTGSFPPTPANGGKVVAMEMVTAAVSSLTAGNQLLPHQSRLTRCRTWAPSKHLQGQHQLDAANAPFVEPPVVGYLVRKRRCVLRVDLPARRQELQRHLLRAHDHYGETLPAASMATMVPVDAEAASAFGSTNGVWVMHMVPIDQRLPGPRPPVTTACSLAPIRAGRAARPGCRRHGQSR